MATMWCEARCAGVNDAAQNTLGKLDCEETATGAFGVKNATSMAKGAGWRVRNGEWFCPRCLRRDKAPSNG